MFFVLAALEKHWKRENQHWNYQKPSTLNPQKPWSWNPFSPFASISECRIVDKATDNTFIQNHHPHSTNPFKERRTSLKFRKKKEKNGEFAYSNGLCFLGFECFFPSYLRWHCQGRPWSPFSYGRHCRKQSSSDSAIFLFQKWVSSRNCPFLLSHESQELGFVFSSVYGT